MKKIRKTNKYKEWAYGTIVCLLYIAFLLWIKSWWGLLVLPFLFDAYFTHKINWGWWKDLENPALRFVMSWVDAIVFALVAVYFVNIYFFQNYTIPSSSLEKSLLVGDYLFVSKTSYGPRAPMTPLSMPLCQHTMFGNIRSYIEWPQWEYHRISPKRVTLNDVVVFNYPSGDTVALNCQNADYYLYAKMLYMETYGMPEGFDSLPALQQYRALNEMISIGSEYIKQTPRQFGDVVSRPVDRRENYVKRCVGLPGQTLQIKNRIVYLDGKANKEPDNVQYNYRVEWRTRPDQNDPILKQAGISYDDLYGMGMDPMFASQQDVLPLTREAKKLLEARTDLVASVTIEPQNETGRLYPLNKETGWTPDNYGPIWIPAKGETIDLTIDNLPLYERPIRVYEGNDLKVTDDGTILINGKEAKSYTFRMDYYWMMGDNRHNSADSRYWGFVPEDHVVGKPIMIWMSINKDYNGIFGFYKGGVRWNRLFRWVDNIK